MCCFSQYLSFFQLKTNYNEENPASPLHLGSNEQKFSSQRTEQTSHRREEFDLMNYEEDDEYLDKNTHLQHGNIILNEY